MTYIPSWPDESRNHLSSYAPDEIVAPETLASVTNLPHVLLPFTLLFWPDILPNCSQKLLPNCSQKLDPIQQKPKHLLIYWEEKCTGPHPYYSLLPPSCLKMCPSEKRVPPVKSQTRGKRLKCKENYFELQTLKQYPPTNSRYKGKLTQAFFFFEEITPPHPHGRCIPYAKGRVISRRVTWEWENSPQTHRVKSNLVLPWVSPHSLVTFP